MRFHISEIVKCGICGHRARGSRGSGPGRLSAHGGLEGVEPLTPSPVEEGRMRVYDAMFDEAFADCSVRNIALSGAYGSGKSSIMQTRMGRDEAAGGRYVVVSLAHFQAKESRGSEDGRGGEGLAAPGPNSSSAAAGDSAEDGCGLEDEVERGIFNQLVYKVPPWRVPRLRTARKIDWSWWFAILIAVFLVAGACVFWLFARNSSGPVGEWHCATKVQAVALFFLAVLGVALLVRYRPLSGLAVSFNIGGNKLDLTGAEDLTFFDRHLDDIVYLINGSGCDAVVFEDIDRFSSPRIFEKLREINALANEARKDSGCRKRAVRTRPGDKCGRCRGPLRFIYLVRDDLFSPKERTKFFDFIIPVIPYVDSMNAPNGLSDSLKNAGFDVEAKLRHGIGLYVDEARTLTEAVNEAVQYREALRDSFDGGWGPDDDSRMLALAVYKVLFPADFSRLQVGKGAVAWLLGRREELLAGLTGRIDSEIGQIRDSIDRMKSELLHDEVELTLLYAGENVQWLLSGDFYSYTARPEEPPNIESCIDKIKSGNGKLLERYKKIQGVFSRDEKFSRRLADLRERDAGGIEKAESRIAALEQEARRFGKMGLADLLRIRGSGNHFLRDGCPAQGDLVCSVAEFKDFCENPNAPLVEFLITNGYIDRTYERYISEYRKGSISASDRAYLKAVVSYADTDPSYEFDMPRDALAWIGCDEWRGEGARNHSLVRALVESGDEACLDSLFGGIIEDLDVRFLADHASGGWADGKFFREMGDRWESAVETVLKSDVSDDAKRVFAQMYLVECGIDDAPVVTLKAIGEFASHDPRFLENNEVPISSGHLKVIDYRSEDMDVERSRSDLLEWVFENGAYAPSVRMLSLALQCFGGCGEEEIDERGLLTSAFSCERAAVRGYAEDHLADLVGSQVIQSASSGDSIRESPETLVRVLNSGVLTASSRPAYLKLYDGDGIERIEAVEDTALWGELFDADFVACIAGNILAAAGNFMDRDRRTLPGWFTGFIGRNSVPDDLARKSAEEGIAEDLLVALCSAGLPADHLDAFASQHEALGTKMEARLVAGISDDECGALIRHHLLAVDAEGLESMRAHHAGLCPAYAAQDAAAYAGLVLAGDGGGAPRCPFDQSGALEIFRDPGVSLSVKIRLLSGCSEPIALPNADYPDGLVAEIVAQDKFGDAFGELAAMYKSAPKRVLREIEGAFSRPLFSDVDGVPAGRSAYSARTAEARRISGILGILADPATPFGLVAHVFGDAEVTEGNKRRLILECALVLSRDQLVECFSQMGLENYARLLSQEGPQRVSGAKFDLDLIEILQKRDFCGKKKPLNSSDELLVFSKGTKRGRGMTPDCADVRAGK